MDMIETYWAGRTFYNIQPWYVQSCDDKLVSVLTQLVEQHPNIDFNERVEFSQPDWQGPPERWFIVHFDQYAHIPALVCAALDGCIKTAQFLLDHGADVNSSDCDFTPIIKSARGISVCNRAAASVDSPCGT